MTLVYIIVLLVVGLFMIFSELFVPGGIIGLIGMVLIGIGVWMCFTEYGPSYGFGVLFLNIILIIVVVIIGFKWLPHSYMGQWLILGDSVSKETGYHSDMYYQKDWVGREGVTESELRPAGIALFGEDRVDVVTEGGYIEPRTPIRVLRVDGNRLVVDRC